MSTNNKIPSDGMLPASWRPSSFEIPPPLKRLFNKFPLSILPSNTLPLRSPQHRDQHTLYVFTTPTDAATGAPSYNPGCLKWQTYLHITSTPFITHPANNHASPSGALPFLLPSSAWSSETTTTTTTFPIPSSRIPAWISTTTSQTPPHKTPSTPLRQIPYTSLLSHNIRLAYLAALYLDPETFDAIAKPLYVATATRSAPVQASLSHSLRSAALGEVLSASNARGAAQTLHAGVLGQRVLDSAAVGRLLQQADEAFEALSVLLGREDYFGDVDDGADEGDAAGADDEVVREGKKEGPNMLDATVFAYTHVILLLFEDVERDLLEEGTPAQRLAGSVRQRENLVRHRARIFERYYSSA